MVRFLSVVMGLFFSLVAHGQISGNASVTLPQSEVPPQQEQTGASNEIPKSELQGPADIQAAEVGAPPTSSVQIQNSEAQAQPKLQDRAASEISRNHAVAWNLEGFFPRNEEIRYGATKDKVKVNEHSVGLFYAHNFGFIEPRVGLVVEKKDTKYSIGSDYYFQRQIIAGADFNFRRNTSGNQLIPFANFSLMNVNVVMESDDGTSEYSFFEANSMGIGASVGIK